MISETAKKNKVEKKETPNQLQNIKKLSSMKAARSLNTRQTLFQPVWAQQMDVAQSDWINHVGVLLSLQFGNTQSFYCLIGGCKKDKPSKNNANFVRHLARVHQLGHLSHFAALVFSCLNSKHKCGSFESNKLLEKKLIDVVENLKNENKLLEKEKEMLESAIPTRPLTNEQPPPQQQTPPCLKDVLVLKKMKCQVVCVDFEFNLGPKKNQLPLEIYLISLVKENHEFHSFFYLPPEVKYVKKLRNYEQKVKPEMLEGAPDKNQVANNLIRYLEKVSEGFSSIKVLAHKGKGCDNNFSWICWSAQNRVVSTERKISSLSKKRAKKKRWRSSLLTASN